MQLGDNDIVIYVGGNITDLQNKMRQAQGVTAATSASMAGTIGRMGGSIERTLKTTGNTIVGATGAASVAMVYPLTRIAGSIFEIGSELDSMSQKTVSVFDLMGRSVNDVKKDLEDFAFSLAGNAMFSANEIMESMYGMAQSGMQVEDIYTLMPEVINLATAQNMDLDTTFRMLYGTLQAYKLNASDATKVTHAMAASMSASVLDAEDLVYALKYINPTFAALGYSYNEGLTMIAMLRDLTFTGQNGGRILRDAFTDLIAPTSEAINIMRKWGISVYTNSDEINGLVAEYYSASEALDQMKSDTSASNEEIQKHKDFIIQLQGQMVGLDKSSEQYKSLKKALDEALYAERVMKNEVKKSSTEIDNQTAKVKALEKQVNDFSATGMKAPAEILNELWKAREAGMTEGEFSTIFGKQSYAAMMQLTRDKEKYAEVLEYVTYTEGEVNEAQRQSDIVTASTAASWTILTNHISSAAGEIYRSVAPALKVLFDSLNENFDGIKEFCILVAQNFVPILQDIANRVIGVVEWFNNLDSGTKELIAKLTAMGVAFTLIGIPLMLFTGIIIWTLSPMVGLIGKIGLAVERIGILRAGMIAFNKDATIFGMNIMNIKGSLSSFLTTLTKGTSAKGITAVTGEIFSSTKALEALGSAGMMINPTLVTTAATTAGVGTATAGLGATILATLSSILPPILIAVAAITALWFAWKNNWFGIRDITANAITFIMEHIKILTDFISETFGVIFGSITNLFDAFINGDVNGLFSALGSLIGGIIRLVGGLPLKLLETGYRMIIDFCKGIIDASPNVGSSLLEWILNGGIQEFIVSAIKAAVEAGAAFVKGFIDGITGKAPDVKEKAKPVGKSVTDGIDDGVESGLPDVYKTMEDGAVESANVFKKKFDESFSKLDMKNMSDDNQMQFKAFEATKNIVDLTDLGDEEKQFIGEVQTIIDENGGEIPAKLKKTLDEQMKESKPFSAFHEEFRKEFDLILYEWAAVDSTIISKMKTGYNLSKPFINFDDGLQDSEKQLINFLDSVASESGKLPEDIQSALNTKLKMKQPLDEWWTDFYSKWKDTEKLIDEPITKTVSLKIEVVTDNVIEDETVEIEESAEEASLLYNNNFSDVLTGNTSATGLKAIINGEIEKTVDTAGKTGELAANNFADTFTTTIEDKQLIVTIYPSNYLDNLDYSDYNVDDYDTSVTQTIDTTVTPTTDEEKKEQANTTSKEEGKELVNSYKEGVEEKKPELDATVETVKTTILDKLNLAEKAYDLGYTFVNSYTNGILAAIPALQSAINQMNGILNSVEAPPVSVTYNVSAAMVNFEGLPQLQGGGTTNNYDIDVNLNNATIRSEQDIDKLADAVYERISRNAGLTA
jgi:TP901 family phage tail tape measure protein